MEQQTTIATRSEVVAECASWLKTPYHTGGKIKGVGADCATFIYCVLRVCGLIPEQEIGFFRQDWWCHTTTEKYMFRLLRHAQQMAEAISYPSLNVLPGNIVLSKVNKSRVYNHGGIVKKWPRVYHAVAPCVAEVDASTHWMWDHRTVLVLDPWEKAINDRG